VLTYGFTFRGNLRDNGFEGRGTTFDGHKSVLDIKK
jgi:hypothetical protein